MGTTTITTTTTTTATETTTTTSTTTFAGPTGSCPHSYTYLGGDVPGGGIRQIEPVNSINSCAGHCNANSNCCSFEYSRRRRRCNLNLECRPTHNVHQDFDFCVKDIGTAERALLEEERKLVGAENVSKNQGLQSALRQRLVPDLP